MDIEQCYENLANAIVLQAVKDYRAAKITLKKNRPVAPYAAASML